MSLSIFVVVLRTNNDQVREWETLALSPAKALMAAQELCPECEVVKIYRKGEWE